MFDMYPLRSSGWHTGLILRWFWVNPNCCHKYMKNKNSKMSVSIVIINHLKNKWNAILQNLELLLDLTAIINCQSRCNYTFLYVGVYHHSASINLSSDIFTRRSAALSVCLYVFFSVRRNCKSQLTSKRLKVTRFPDWMSSTSLSLGPDSSWHMAVTHCKASLWADLMQSTRPRRNRRVDALS
jgi:hypothetical protein